MSSQSMSFASGEPDRAPIDIFINAEFRWPARAGIAAGSSNAWKSLQIIVFLWSFPMSR
jgi:4-diphosphocytidyl-2C-methyl-D-erythritol kinase